MKVITIIISLFCILHLISCSNVKAQQFPECLPEAKDTVSFNVLGKKCGKKIIINDTIDLTNNACVIPHGMTLFFKGGCIKNGTLIGNFTKIKTSSCCFSRVRIKGSWFIPEISSDLFEDLSYENALKDVFALSDPKIMNSI